MQNGRLIIALLCFCGWFGHLSVLGLGLLVKCCDWYDTSFILLMDTRMDTHTNAHIEKHKYRGRFIHTYTLTIVHFGNRNTLLTLSRDVFAISRTWARLLTFNTIPELELAQWLQTWGGETDRLYNKVAYRLRFLIPAVQKHHPCNIQLEVPIKEFTFSFSPSLCCCFF